MVENAEQLLKMVRAFYQKYKSLPEEITKIRLSDDRWSLREIVGHLIDSASNNHQRFIRMQLERECSFPDYNKDEWLQTSFYNGIDFKELLRMLKSYNQLIAHLIAQVSEMTFDHIWNKPWDQKEPEITLKDLIEHYIHHFQLHIDHFEERLAEITVFR